MKTKGTSLQAEEDRISALPDCLIQHILSLLPSTNEAIRTTILSKRWHNQWTHVPVLVFDSTGISFEKFSRLIYYTLIVHDCSKIKKLRIQQDQDHWDKDHLDILTINWDVIFRFAIKRDVEDLFMGLCLVEEELRVPKFVFEHPSYVKLYMSDCDFSYMPNRNVSWANLKALVLSSCVLPNQAIENILSGSPSLESFEFYPLDPSTHYDIVSKSLKKLVLFDYDCSSTLRILCPNLEELCLYGSFKDSATLQLMNSSSLIRADLGFGYDYAEINNLMQYFKHVKELEFGSAFINSLSALNSSGADLSPLLLNNKSLTLTWDKIFEEHNAGFECALRLSHVLQKLVIVLAYGEYFQWNVYGENYWNSNTTVFNCLVSHLKIVEINYGLYFEFVLPFIKFLLKNARVLEKLVVRIDDGSKDFAFQVSQKLLDFPRCSQHATVKVYICSD